MKKHARAGYDILVGSSSKVLQLASQIALRHHERWDGTGYPDHLRGTQIRWPRASLQSATCSTR